MILPARKLSNGGLKHNNTIMHKVCKQLSQYNTFLELIRDLVYNIDPNDAALT